ncbi:MAG TPA: vWA domain-containing protein [Victivallales bacterium]|nr:vWA domain-containing protein [Victivallales bacterium]
MNQTIKQKPIERKLRGVADIVFCIDASGSMKPCLKGLKDHIEKFLDGLSSNKQITSLSWRLGIVAHDEKRFYILDFTSDLARFKGALKKIKTGKNEFTLPALDWSLDFPWNENAHKIVIAFTDEPLKDGYNPDFQASKKDQLFEKIKTLRCMVYFVGPECPVYKEIQKLPRCFFVPIKEQADFFKVGFEQVLERIGRTLSGSVASSAQTPKGKIEKDIYNIKEKIKVIKL